MNLNSENTTGNIQLQNIKYDEINTTLYSNIHAVIRDKTNLDNSQTGSIEHNITKSINCVSIDWNTAKFVKLAEVLRDSSSLLYGDDILNDIVTNGIKESSQLIYLLEKYAEALGTYLFYIGAIIYKDENNEDKQFAFRDVLNNQQLLNNIIEYLKSSNILTHSIRTIEDIYAPTTNNTLGNDGNTYHLRLIQETFPNSCYMICPKSMFTYLCGISKYKNGSYYDFIVDPESTGDLFMMQVNSETGEPYNVTFIDNNIEYIIVGWRGFFNKTLIFRDYNIISYENLFSIN